MYDPLFQNGLANSLEIKLSNDVKNKKFFKRKLTK